MAHVGLCGLAPLMALTRGDPDLVIGLIDGPVAGPVAVDHPGLEPCRVRGISVPVARHEASRHGTFVAGVLVGRRTTGAPALCPGCTLLSRPLRADGVGGELHAAPGQLAAAIDDCLEAGAHILNISAVLAPAAAAGSGPLTGALDRAARRGALVVVAAGEAELPGGSALTCHPWVVPVASCTGAGTPSRGASLGSRLVRRGLSAPGDRITSLDAPDGVVTWSGSGAATPFVTGAAALLWSAQPHADVDALRHALLSTAQGSRAAESPPLLDAWAAYQSLGRPSPACGPRACQRSIL